MHVFAQGIRRRWAHITFQDIPVEPWRDEAAQAGLAVHVGPPAAMGRSAARGAFRPAVGRLAALTGQTAAERAGVCPKECGRIYRAAKAKEA